LSGQGLLNEMTFDLDIWHGGSSITLWVKFIGQGQRSEFAVTGVKKINRRKTFCNTDPPVQSAVESSGNIELLS